VRIFTPGAEIPFAGHPTVGTAHVLFALGRLRAPDGARETRVILEEGVGDVPVTVRFPERGEEAFGGVEPEFAQLTAAKLPEERREHDVDALAAALSLSPDDFVGGDWGPMTVSCGLPFVLVPVKSRAAVSRARVRLDEWERRLPASAWSREPMVFAMDAEGPGVDVHARVFVPTLGVPEDPATGSANAALGGYLAARAPRAWTGRCAGSWSRGSRWGARAGSRWRRTRAAGGSRPCGSGGARWW
jgi:trans-2,3-dihydro-3-hydroxyanthranilate isomerase